uniref:protein kinase C n=1 Tax=Timema cristinae TaxID=61476 RepID=A0A7R9GZK2_TIMCR|nr:unnamed protein product [Timema cristinae]
MSLCREPCYAQAKALDASHNGDKFARAFCAFCQDRIWGLGRQGFKCIQCKLLVHKKCHKLVQKPCSNEQVEPIVKEEQNGETPSIGTPTTELLPDLKEFPEPPLDLTTDSVPVEDHTKSKFGKLGAGEEALEQTGSQRQYSLIDFELIRVIGRGSYAKVLMVELKKTRRIYAMKVIKKALVTDDEDIDWVQTEKHVFETASNHPFLVGLHSCFQTPSRLFFVIEFVRGGDLMFHMQRQRRLPEEHARFYAAEISLALNFLHDKGVLLYEMLAGRSPFDIAGASENPDQNTEDYLFQVILEKTIRIPRSLSVKAASVLKGFLNKNPADRLGCHRETGFLDIVNHPFFKSIDWELLNQKHIIPPYTPPLESEVDLDNFDPQFTLELLEQKQVPPPYKPRLESDRDLANFPPEFTDEPVHLTPDDTRVIEKIDQSEFEGFEYVNPLLMSLEDCV